MFPYLRKYRKEQQSITVHDETSLLVLCQCRIFQTDKQSQGRVNIALESEYVSPSNIELWCHNLYKQ